MFYLSRSISSDFVKCVITILQLHFIFNIIHENSTFSCDKTSIILHNAVWVLMQDYLSTSYNQGTSDHWQVENTIKSVDFSPAIPENEKSVSSLHLSRGSGKRLFTFRPAVTPLAMFPRKSWRLSLQSSRHEYSAYSLPGFRIVGCGAMNRLLCKYEPLLFVFNKKSRKLENRNPSLQIQDTNQKASERQAFRNLRFSTFA